MQENNEYGCKRGYKWCDESDDTIVIMLAHAEQCKCVYGNIYWVDAKVSADFFSFLCFKFLLKQNTINQQRIYHCYL